MIVLLDTSHDLAECAKELRRPTGQLLTPLTRYRNRAVGMGLPFAIDNGAFSAFNARAFLSLLDREKPRREHCLFVAVPDVVGSARRTLEVFRHWFPKLHGWPLALVAQNGIEDLDIPWGLLAAVFIGGDNRFKDGPDAGAVVKAAKAMDKWVHVGRINGPERFERFEELGADSCDGSGIARYTHMRQKLVNDSPKLWEASNAGSL